MEFYSVKVGPSFLGPSFLTVDTIKVGKKNLVKENLVIEKLDCVNAYGPYIVSTGDVSTCRMLMVSGISHHRQSVGTRRRVLPQAMDRIQNVIGFRLTDYMYDNGATDTVTLYVILKLICPKH